MLRPVRPAMASPEAPSLNTAGAPELGPRCAFSGWIGGRLHLEMNTGTVTPWCDREGEADVPAAEARLWASLATRQSAGSRGRAEQHLLLLCPKGPEKPPPASVLAVHLPAAGSIMGGRLRLSYLKISPKINMQSLLGNSPG